MSKEIPQEEIPFSKEDTNISINPPKKEITPPPTYTPLSQNAKPFLSKRLKNISSQKSNEQLNKNEMKRINYVKKNDFNESPIFSYFNSSKKYISEEYDKNININKDNDKKQKKDEKKSEKKPLPKKEKSDSDSDDEEDEKEKPKEEKRAKETAKKEESSDEEKEKEEEENEKQEKKEESDNDEELPPNAYEELFVRNIGYNTTQEGLADYFAKYGDVEESKIVTDKQTGKSRGFGFLKFYEKKSAVAAMKDADNIVVDGRNLQIRYSNDKGSQMKGGNSNSAKKGPSSEFGVFVGNISYKCTENDLKKFFKDCGKVVDVRIAKKPDGKLKGFAHVDFETKEGMEKAVEKNGNELQGRALKIDKSSSGNGKGGNGGNRGKGRGNNNADPMAKAKRTGGIIAPTENKVTTYDDSDDDE